MNNLLKPKMTQGQTLNNLDWGPLVNVLCNFLELWLLWYHYIKNMKEFPIYFYVNHVTSQESITPVIWFEQIWQKSNTPNFRALGLVVFDKISKVFHFSCHSNKISAWNEILWCSFMQRTSQPIFINSSPVVSVRLLKQVIDNDGIVAQ